MRILVSYKKGINLREKWHLPISPLRIANPEQGLLNATERQMAIESRMCIFIFVDFFIFYVCILKVLLELKYNHSIDRLNIINILKYLPSDIVHKVTKRYIAIIRWPFRVFVILRIDMQFCIQTPGMKLNFYL